MNKGNSEWHNAILSRFGKREDFGKDGLYKRYFKSDELPREAVLECFDLIESEYGISVGILRPDDVLTKLFEPVITRNPLKWLEYQLKAGDKQSELNYQLNKRLRKHNIFELVYPVITVDDFVHAWCGQKPIQP